MDLFPLFYLCLLSICVLLSALRKQIRHTMVRAGLLPLGSPTILHLVRLNQDPASDPKSRADPLELIFANIEVLENQVRDLQLAVPMPKGLPTKMKGSSQ